LHVEEKRKEVKELRKEGERKEKKREGC